MKKGTKVAISLVLGYLVSKKIQEREELDRYYREQYRIRQDSSSCEVCEEDSSESFFDEIKRLLKEIFTFIFYSSLLFFIITLFCITIILIPICVFYAKDNILLLPVAMILAVVALVLARQLEFI